MLNINSSVAASLAIFVTIKEKHNSNLKANIFLVVGLVLWFIANIVWAYYEVILHLMASVPSLADVLLLSAYSILIVHSVLSFMAIMILYGLKKENEKKEEKNYMDPLLQLIQYLHMILTG